MSKPFRVEVARTLLRAAALSVAGGVDQAGARPRAATPKPHSQRITR